MDEQGTKTVIYAALIGNLLVAITKLAAALFTGSSAMFSEAVHSMVDTSNELVLIYGVRRGTRPPDEAHPFGHGRELYFWSFIVSLLILTVGAGVSMYEGINHVLRPDPIRNPMVNYMVLGAALVFEGGSWIVALRGFRTAKGNRGYFQAVRESKDPTTFMVLFEDSAALLGIVIAFAGIAGSQAFALPLLDGVASIGISLLLGTMALFLARETKDLLIGEPANSAIVGSICAVAKAQPGIQHMNGLFTVQLGPDQVVAAVSVEFVESLSAAEVEQSMMRMEARVKALHPQIVALLIRLSSRRAV